MPTCTKPKSSTDSRVTSPCSVTLQPELTDAGQAMNEHQCEAVPERGTPLIVDWGSHQKADLEEIMRGGLAVVAYDCEKLELLADCQVQGSYGWMGSELKQDMVSLAGLGEIAANLPTRTCSATVPARHPNNENAMSNEIERMGPET